MDFTSELQGVSLHFLGQVHKTPQLIWNWLFSWAKRGCRKYAWRSFVVRLTLHKSVKMSSSATGRGVADLSFPIRGKTLTVGICASAFILFLFFVSSTYPQRSATLGVNYRLHCARVLWLETTVGSLVLPLYQICIIKINYLSAEQQDPQTKNVCIPPQISAFTKHTWPRCASCVNAAWRIKFCSTILRRSNSSR